MKQNFVTFYSPGTFLAEETTKKIDEWDVESAIEMSKEIQERYGAIPYGFQFSARERGDDELDSHKSETSPFYFLGGEVFTIDQLKKIGSPDNDILIRNMECNGIEKVVVNTNSWKWTQPMKDGNVIIQFRV